MPHDSPNVNISTSVKQRTFTCRCTYWAIPGTTTIVIVIFFCRHRNPDADSAVMENVNCFTPGKMPTGYDSGYCQLTLPVFGHKKSYGQRRSLFIIWTQKKFQHCPHVNAPSSRVRALIDRGQCHYSKPSPSFYERKYALQRVSDLCPYPMIGIGSLRITWPVHKPLADWEYVSPNLKISPCQHLSIRTEIRELASTATEHECVISDNVVFSFSL